MRKLMWLTIGFAVASLTGALANSTMLLILFAVAILATTVLVFFIRKSNIFKLAMLITLGCSLGCLWFGVYDQLFVTLPRMADGQSLYVTIEASNYNIANDNGNSVEGTVHFADKEYRVKAYLHTDTALAPGDQVSGKFRFRLTTDGGLEDPTSHRTEGIYLLAYPEGRTDTTKAEQVSWKYYPAVWRKLLLERIHEILPGETGGFAAALLLGDRSGVTYEMNTAFKVSGISHIIAVSGLHVSILFALIYTLLARRRLLSCLICIPALFLFAAVAGFSPSITRACIMQSLMLIALLFDREYDGPTALSFAVLVMLIANPLTVLSISFQLSVGCLIGIFLFGERIRTYFRKISEKPPFKGRKRLTRFWNSVGTSISITLSATITTTPLVAYYFGCISTVSVLTNLLTLWVISFVFYGLIFLLLMSLISLSVAQFLGSILSLPVWYVLLTAKVVSRLPMSALYTCNIYAIVWLVGIYGLLILFLHQRRKRPVLLIACAIATLLLTNTLSWLEPMRDHIRVTMLDVGQGQCILLQSDGKTFLVDCGGDYDSETADTAAETLLSQGISRVDGLILTHFDDDHAGAVENLLTRIDCDHLILPYFTEGEELGLAMAEQAQGIAEFIRHDKIYTFGNTKLTIFAPISQISGNESGICILFQWQDYDILITGDRGFAGEAYLLEHYDLPQVDVLVAGHHGSADSTSQALLDAVDPTYVWISVGEDNNYGHPATELLERLAVNGCTVYRTDINGTIIFRR